MIDAVVRARMASTRLPGKTLLRAGGATMLEHTVRRLGAARLVGRIVVATSSLPEDDAVAEECAILGIPCYRGSADDVLGRVHACAAEHGMRDVGHFGADNPLIDPLVCDDVAAAYAAGEWDYVTNNLPPTFPDGQEVEITSFETLDRCARKASSTREREHLLTYVWDHAEAFRIHNVAHEPDLHHIRMTLDTEDDWRMIAAVLDELAAGDPCFGMDEVIELLRRRPDLAASGEGYGWRER